MTDRPDMDIPSYFDALHASMTNQADTKDQDIDRLEREIGANEAIIACTSSPGWKMYRAALVAKFQGLMVNLARGMTLTEGERYHLQGRIQELEQIVLEGDHLRKDLLERKHRLDQLQLERKNLEEEEALLVPSIGGTS